MMHVNTTTVCVDVLVNGFCYFFFFFFTNKMLFHFQYEFKQFDEKLHPPVKIQNEVEEQRHSF